MSHNQKIDCNVTKCMHNCIDDCSCRLERIQVCPTSARNTDTYDDETACGMYTYVGDLNTQEKTISRQA